MKKIDWPEHEDVRIRRQVNFDIYYPAVADAMREQGMTAFKHLANRVAWILQQPQWHERFGGINPDPNHIHSLISENAQSPKATAFLQEGEYRNLALVVAFALEKSPVALFGLPPEAQDNEPSIFGTDIQLVGTFSNEVFLTEDETMRDQQELRELLAGVLESLRPEERQIIELRYGLNGHAPHRLTEVADILGLDYGNLRNQIFEIRQRIKNGSAGELLQLHYEDDGYEPSYCEVA